MSEFGARESPDLYDAILNLDIVTGRIGRNEIQAWYDTDCKDTLDFLFWLKTFVNKRNVISIQDKQAYQFLEDNNLVLYDEKLKSTVNDIESNYPQIFDLDLNLFEKECIQDEIQLCEDDAKQLEQQIVMNKELNKKLQHKLSNVMEIEATLKINLDKAAQDCLNLCNQLDETNRNMEAQIIKYGAKSDSCFTFSKSINMDDCNHSYNNISSDINYSIKKEIKVLPNLESILNSNKKKPDESLFHTSLFVEITDDMPKRIVNSVLYYISAKAEEDTLEATLNYLNANILELMFNSTVSNQSVVQLNAITSKLEGEALETVKKIISMSKLHIAIREIKCSREKLKYLSTVRAKFDEIIAYFVLLPIMCETEISDIKYTKKFIHEVGQYITCDLEKYKMRKDIMMGIIGDYNDHKLRPFESKFKLVKNILSLILDSDRCFNMQEALKLIHDFFSKCDTIEQNKYFTNISEFKSKCRFMEHNLKVSKCFLTSGPTSEYVCIPNDLYITLTEITEALMKQDSELKYCIVTSTETEKEINADKWLCIRRQLWMYFLINPKKMLDFIDKISNECNIRIKTAFK